MEIKTKLKENKIFAVGSILLLILVIGYVVIKPPLAEEVFQKIKNYEINDAIAYLDDVYPKDGGFLGLFEEENKENKDKVLSSFAKKFEQEIEQEQKPSDKWDNPQIKEAVNKINRTIHNGELATFDLKKLDIEGATDLELYAQAMNTMYTEFHANLDMEMRLSLAKKDIEQISSSYNGPFSEDIQRLKRCISNKEPEIGISKVELLIACGNPKDINTTKTASNISEQWVYHNGLYVYLDNGKVTAIQN